MSEPILTFIAFDLPPRMLTSPAPLARPASAINHTGLSIPFRAHLISTLDKRIN
jgi:hypothetical protein